MKLLKSSDMKVLMVLPSLTQANGIVAFVFNYLKKIANKDISFTILASDMRPSNNYLDLASFLDIDVHFVRNIEQNGFSNYYKDLKCFFKSNHDFDAVYSNVANQSLFVFRLAKKYGIKTRIIHSHATSAASSLFKRIRNNFLIFFMLRYATHYLACSDAAGKSMFKKRDFTVINNAIDYEKYVFSLSKREKIRNEYNLIDKKVVGYVGRIVQQKNVLFLTDVCEKLPNEYVFLIIGTGNMKESLLDEVRKKRLTSRFIFVDECTNVDAFYSAMDYFVLPSFYEGLPVVGVEAQANGLPCFFSNRITKEVVISSNSFILDIESANLWANSIQEHSARLSNLELSTKFDINVQCDLLFQTISNAIRGIN